MRTTPACEMAMQLAIQETASAGFLEIEPEHLVMGLFKLAELPSSTGSPDDESARPAFREEVTALAKRIKELGIDSAASRRQLRSRLGRGPATIEHTSFKYSLTAKAITDKADAHSARGGASSIRPIDLFEAILETPTPLIAECLARVSNRPQAVVAGPSLLDEHGTDLVRRAAAGELSPPSGSRAAWRAMYLVLSALKPRNVLAIAPSMEAGRRTVEAMAHAIQVGEAAGLSRTRLIDLTEFLAEPINTSDKIDLLTRMLEEARDAHDAIVVIFWGQQMPGEAGTIASLLESLCDGSTLRIVVVTTEEHAEIPGLQRRFWLGRMQAMNFAFATETRPPDAL